MIKIRTIVIKTLSGKRSMQISTADEDKINNWTPFEFFKLNGDEEWTVDFDVIKEINELKLKRYNLDQISITE